MTDKDPKDMTASEMLRSIADRCRAEGLGLMGEVELLRRAFGAERDKYHCEIDMVNTIIAIADKIDAELAQARRSGLERAAKSWAKANGWPDFREGEDFGAWLERCALKRPCYDDGEPVNSSDLDEIGALATCCVHMDGSWEFDPDKYEDEMNPKPWDVQKGARDDRVKRPATEVLLGDGKPVSKGETVYVTDSGIERTVKDFGTQLCEGMDGWDGSPWVMFDNGSWMHARDLTHERPVLGADGLPIKVGETVWNTFSWHKGVVKALNVNGKSTAYVEWSDGKWSPCVRLNHLTHTTPDTHERIDADARKSTSDYWECRDIDCDECPSIVDGSKPYERHGVSNCRKAMTLDLLRRQRELDARNGGAE